MILVGPGHLVPEIQDHRVLFVKNVLEAAEYLADGLGVELRGGDQLGDLGVSLLEDNQQTLPVLLNEQALDGRLLLHLVGTNVDQLID